MSVPETDHQLQATSIAGDEILTALADPDSRRILAIASRDPVIVSEIIERIDIPRATAYRKANRLAAMGLLRSQPRIRSDDRNATEYRLDIESITIQFGEGTTPEITVSPRHENLVPVTDGGEPTDSGSGDKRQLQDLFVDITGTDEITESQRRETPNRAPADETTRSVSGDAAAVVREDGLDDTLPEPEGTDE